LATALPEDGTGGLQRNWSATDGFLGVRLGNDHTASITIIDTLTALAWLVPDGASASFGTALARVAA